MLSGQMEIHILPQSNVCGQRLSNQISAVPGTGWPAPSFRHQMT